MSQLQRGTVVVTNGSPTVRGVYVAHLASPSGSFPALGAISWASAAGSGTIVSYDAPTQTLRFIRTSGAAPVVGNAVAAVAGGAGTIDFFQPDNLPNFLAETTGFSPLYFEVVNGTAFYSVIGATADTVTLSNDYAGATDYEAGYAIFRDFEPYLGLDLPAPGNVNLASSIARNAVKVGQAYNGADAAAIPLASGWGAFSSLTAKVRKGADREVRLEGAVTHASATVPATLGTLVVGQRPARTRRFSVAAGSSGNATVEVQADGDLVVVQASVALSAGIYLDGIQFRAEG